MITWNNVAHFANAYCFYCYSFFILKEHVWTSHYSDSCETFLIFSQRTWVNAQAYNLKRFDFVNANKKTSRNIMFILIELNKYSRQGRIQFRKSKKNSFFVLHIKCVEFEYTVVLCAKNTCFVCKYLKKYRRLRLFNFTKIERWKSEGKNKSEKLIAIAKKDNCSKLQT